MFTSGCIVYRFINFQYLVRFLNFLYTDKKMKLFIQKYYEPSGSNLNLKNINNPKTFFFSQYYSWLRIRSHSSLNGGNRRQGWRQGVSFSGPTYGWGLTFRFKIETVTFVIRKPIKKLEPYPGKYPVIKDFSYGRSFTGCIWSLQPNHDKPFV